MTPVPQEFVPLQLEVVLDVDEAHAQPPFDPLPYGWIASIALPDRAAIETYKFRPNDPEPVAVELPLPQANAQWFYEFWSNYAKRAGYRNCHFMSHAVAGLHPVDQPSNNLLLTDLVLDPRDAESLLSQELHDLQAGAAYTILAQTGDGLHSVVGAGSDLILHTHKRWSGPRLDSLPKMLAKPPWGSGFRVVRLSRPSPSIGTNYWYTRSMEPADDRPVDVQYAHEHALQINDDLQRAATLSGKLKNWAGRLAEKVRR